MDSTAFPSGLFGHRYISLFAHLLLLRTRFSFAMLLFFVDAFSAFLFFDP